MRAEQGDVEMIRAGIESDSGDDTSQNGAFAALDRLAAHMQAQDARIRTLDELEKNLGEVEADAAFLDDYLRAQGEWIQRAKEWQARAEKAERALAEMRATLQRIANIGDPVAGTGISRSAQILARAALRPSDEVSDEFRVTPGQKKTLDRAASDES